MTLVRFLCGVHWRILLLAAVSIAAFTSSAQPSADSARVHALIEQAGEVLQEDPDSAERLCEQALPLARRAGYAGDVADVLGWLAYLAEQRGAIDTAIALNLHALEVLERSGGRKGQATLLNNLGAIYKDQGRIEEALDMHRRSLDIRRSIGDTVGLATSLNNIGLILYDQGRIAEAMEHYSEALEHYEATDEQEGVATALHNIAGIYRDQGDLREALDHFKRALLIHTAAGDTYGMAGTEDNIGGVLEALGMNDEALRHYGIALALHERIGDQRGMGYSLRNIAGIELKRAGADSALAHARRSVALFSASDDKRGRASALWMTGLALEQLGQGTEAERSAREALVIARELGYPLLMRDAALLLERLYRNNGRWKDAIDMQDLYYVMRDSVLGQDARRSALRQQFQYAYEKKEADLRAEQFQRDLLAQENLRKEKNRRNLLLYSGIGVLFAAIGLWRGLRDVRRSRAALQREKDVSEGLLLNILPDVVAQELKSKGQAEARQIDNVTVLFTDFKGFTAMSEKVTAKELVHDLNECFSAFDHICVKHGVEKIKTIGDAYMAAGGLPVPNTTHAVDVVKAALEIRDFLAEGKARKVAAGLPYFEIRIGVHSGPVVAGIVGVKKFQYDIWGDTVNTASRMESSGEVGQVNISEATYALVREQAGSLFNFTPRGKVQAKGKGEMEMYFVHPSPDAVGMKANVDPTTT